VVTKRPHGLWTGDVDSALTTIKTVGDLRRHLQYFGDDMELVINSSELGERQVSFISATYQAGTMSDGTVRLYLAKKEEST
jgi:hypothetical protein